MALIMEAEVYRIDRIEARNDFEGGATLRLGDEDGEVSIWVPAQDLAMLSGLQRLQRVSARLRAREAQYTTSRDGASRSTKACKLGLVSIKALGAPAPKVAA